MSDHTFFQRGLHGASERYAGRNGGYMICVSGRWSTPSVVRRRLSKRHRPLRYLAPIKFLYLQYLRHCAPHLAPRFRSERPRRGSGRFFSECPRPLNHLHRRALDRRAGISILVGTINVLLHFLFPLPNLRRPQSHISVAMHSSGQICRRNSSLFSFKGSDLCFATCGARGEELVPAEPVREDRVNSL